MELNTESRKKVKIYDTFLFNNEMDLLEIRLNILDSYVDYFVLVEARETFSGNPKPLYYYDNKERYKEWSDKIIHIVVDNSKESLWEFAKSSPNVGHGEHWWVREFYQKENLLSAFNQSDDDDIVFVSDLDEIWDPEVVFKEGYSYDNNSVYRPIQVAYHYYLNNRSNQDISGWVGTRFGSVRNLKKFGSNHFRTEREIKSINIENGGWHFTNIGNFEFIKTKLESYGHQEYNNDYVKNIIKICMERNIDFLNRGFRLWKDESSLPKYLMDNKQKYKHLLI